MNEMIERVAQKLYGYDASNADYRWGSWNFAAVSKQQKYRERANVCIEVMREPTDAMLIAAHEAPQTYGNADNKKERMAWLPGWKAAIDEALK